MKDKLNLLIVDDDYAVLEIMWNIAQQIDGIEVDKTDNPLSAIKLLEAKTYHLLLTDLVMPDINGIELMKKAHEVQPDLCIAVVTGFGDLELALGAIKEGAYGYIHKPFRPEELALIIQNMAEKLMIQRRIESQQLEIENLRSQLNQCQLVEQDLRKDLGDLHEKLDAIGIPTEKNKGNILTAIDKAARNRVQNTGTSDLARELTNLNTLYKEKKITEEEFNRFRQHILKKTYGE